MSGSPPKSARRSAFPSRRKWPGRGEWKPFLSWLRKRTKKRPEAGPPCTRPKAPPPQRERPPPQPKTTIGAALPIGCLSRGDLIDAWLERELEPDEVAASLRGAAPPGIEIEGVTRLEAMEPVLQGRIQAAVYEGTLEGFPEPIEMSRRIEAMMASDHLPRVRRDKTYDL